MIASTQFFLIKIFRKNLKKVLEPRIIKLKNGYEDMSNLLGGNIESVKFSGHAQQNTTKIEELENKASPKGKIRIFQKNH